jgi:acid phosphatase/lysosomal acid phosphatase/prostatic aicd phosphatase
LQQVTAIFNLSKPLTLSSLSSLTSDVYCSIFQNAELPKGLSPEILANMSKLKDLSVQYVAVGSVEERKLLSTPFLSTLQQYFQSKAQGNTDLKYIIFSAHDTTIQPYLAALNMTSWQCILQQIDSKAAGTGNCVPGYPVFASQLLFELHSNITDAGKDFFVKAFYNGVAMNLCEREGFECPLGEFSQRISDFVLSNEEFQASCGAETLEFAGFLRKKAAISPF